MIGWGAEARGEGGSQNQLGGWEKNDRVGYGDKVGGFNSYSATYYFGFVPY